MEAEGGMVEEEEWEEGEVVPDEGAMICQTRLYAIWHIKRRYLAGFQY